MEGWPCLLFHFREIWSYPKALKVETVALWVSQSYIKRVTFYLVSTTLTQYEMFENFVSDTLVFSSRDHTQEARFLILTPTSIFCVTLSSQVLCLSVTLYPSTLKKCLHVGLALFKNMATKTMLSLSAILCPFPLVSSFLMKMFKSYFLRDSRLGVFEDINSQVIRIDIRQCKQSYF